MPQAETKGFSTLLLGNPQKIAAIGRSQDDGVVPFANKLLNELDLYVHQIKEWPVWNSNHTIEQNWKWTRKLNSAGNTIFEIGMDPRYGNDKEPSYGLEFGEFFGNYI